MSRRTLLAAGTATLFIARQKIQIAIAPDVGRAIGEGLRFGLAEARRAAVLLGGTIEEAGDAPAVVQRDGRIESHGQVFSLTSPASYEAPPRQAVVEWHHSLARFGASELNERFTRATGRRMAAGHWIGWMAVKAIAEASLRARSGETLAAALARSRFDGHKGVALRFDASRHLVQPIYVVDLESDRVVSER